MGPHKAQLSMTTAITVLHTIMLLSNLSYKSVTLSQWDKVVNGIHYIVMPATLIAATVSCILQRKTSTYRYFRTATEFALTAVVVCVAYSVLNQTDAAVYIGIFIASSNIINVVLLASLTLLYKDEKNRD